MYTLWLITIVVFFLQLEYLKDLGLPEQKYLNIPAKSPIKIPPFFSLDKLQLNPEVRCNDLGKLK